MLRETLGQRACDEIIRIAAQPHPPSAAHRRLRRLPRPGRLRGGRGRARRRQRRGDASPSRIQAALDQAVLDPRRRAAHQLQHRGDAARRRPARRRSASSPTPASRSRAAQKAGPASVRYFRESAAGRGRAARGAVHRALGRARRAASSAPYFQPQIDLATGAFSGFEALVRWEHPRARRCSRPPSFLDFAEQTDLTERIGEVVLARTLARDPRLGRGRARGAAGRGQLRAGAAARPAADREDQVGGRAQRRRPRPDRASRCSRRC